ncbi:hypothetical protein B0H14DRAFT_3497717 [Mycena olivaceomarginata]|nr:hypothetical protein B0H14DRAFT_3497717 [Mycena olivaceomarginata]
MVGALTDTVTPPRNTSIFRKHIAAVACPTPLRRAELFAWTHFFNPYYSFPPLPALAASNQPTDDTASNQSIPHLARCTTLALLRSPHKPCRKDGDRRRSARKITPNEFAYLANLEATLDAILFETDNSGVFKLPSSSHILSSFRWQDMLQAMMANSSTASQLLNNILPKYIENGLAKQRDQIRGWIMKDARKQALADAVAMIMGTNKPTTNGETLIRIELSELLMNEYLYAKQDWEVEPDALIGQASLADLGTPESQKALNDLTRKLAHITATRQAQLAVKYSDTVVRGYSNTVREYMGYLDIASPAEALQNAKDSLREAAMSSLDDLTQDPEVITMQIDAKSQQLDILNSQLVSLQMGTKGDAADLRNKIAAAQTALDSAQSTLSQAYPSNVIAMANTCLDAVGKLPAMMDAVQKAQHELTSSSRALSQMMAALALAEATDTKQQKLALRIQSLTGELKELQTRW